MNDRLFALRLLATVVRRGSFSAAARELGISQPTASKTIAALEKDVGAPLVVRTTRTVTPTDVGQTYLARVSPALSVLDEADHEARGGGELRGVLRIAVTSSIAVRELIPRLPNFAAQHPLLQIVLSIDDERRPLVEEGIDVALRLGPLSESTMVVRNVGHWPFVIVASPAYLDRAGHPATPAQLRILKVIAHSESPNTVWTFRRSEMIERIELNPDFIISSNEGCIAAAKAGLGFTSSATIAIRRELKQGRLVRLLPEWDIGTLHINIVLPSGKASKPAARAFAKFILDSKLP